jgi:lipopolysaccharide export system protein LptA
MTISKIYINTLLSLLAVFSLWIVWYFSIDYNMEKPYNPYTPNEFVRNVKVTAMNSAGHWSYQFYSPSALHYPDKNRTTFMHPVLVLFQENAPEWQASALNGEALNGNAEIHLMGNVILNQPQGSHNAPTRILTHSVVMYPENRIVTTQDNVVAIRTDATVTSVGMKLDILHQVLTLFSQVHGIYKPKNKQPIDITSASAQLIKVKETGLGTTIFQRNVRLIQGNSLLVTPELTVRTDKNDQIIDSVAKGAGSTYTNKQNINKPPFVATASEIRYLPLQQEVFLVGNAKAQQGVDSYSAPQIHYHIDKESVISQQGRIKMVILPKSFEKTGKST